MIDIEKRAQEVEAALREQVICHRDLSNPLYMSAHGRLLHQAAEIIAALTPPEGYVLVPVEPTDRMIGEGILAYNGKCEESYAAMIAARPEVK